MADEAPKDHKDKKGEKGEEVDYTLANPDTLTKYKAAADISQKVLSEITKKCKDGASIFELCEAGDKLLEEETAKVFKGKNVSKGLGFPTTITPNDYITPYTPFTADEKPDVIKAGDILKLQLGAQIDGFDSMVGGTLVAPKADSDEPEIDGDTADLLLATHYSYELMLRLLIPPSVSTQKDVDKKDAKPLSQSKITALLDKVAKSYDCTVIESTTSWLLERYDIESKKRIVLNPGEGTKGEGSPEVGEVWGVEVSLTKGNGKSKELSNKSTLFRKTGITLALKRPSSRAVLSEIIKKYNTFPFTLRSLQEKNASAGLLESVRGGLVREYKVEGTKDGKACTSMFGVVAITKKGITKITNPIPVDLEKVKSDKKIEDEEILKLLEIPLSSAKPKKKKADA